MGVLPTLSVNSVISGLVKKKSIIKTLFDLLQNSRLDDNFLFQG